MVRKMSDDLQVVRQAATLRRQVEDKLRGAIASGRFQPGQRLVERELCELIGVGRTSIREALRQLEAEGLVLTIPHRGPVVSTITTSEAKELYAVRALLEGDAGRGFAQHHDGAQLLALQNSIALIKRAAEQTDQGLMLEAKTAFYQILMDGCGNRFIKQFLMTIHNRVNLLRVKSMMEPGRSVHSLAEINEIYEAVAARDGDRAAVACSNHIRAAAAIALRMLGSEQGASADTAKKRKPAVV
jgi:DNA-binding GntR family transcriptional regulator